MDYIGMPCIDFVNRLCSKDPTPGGGGACALAGSLGIALGNMVGSLTLGKPKYADVEEDIVQLMDRASKLQTELLVMVEKDAMAFEPLANAYSLPDDTDEEKKIKEGVMEEALKVAVEVPLDIMKKSAQAIEVLEEFGKKGSKMAISDVGVGVSMAMAAIEGAALNVFINTKVIRDREVAKGFNEAAHDIMERYMPRGKALYEAVKNELLGTAGGDKEKENGQAEKKK